jgi:hypothetical protein
VAIGVNWKEVWADVWADVWQNTPPVEVPDVVGQSQASATTEIEGEGFVVAVETAYSSTVPVGNVISQVPTAGTLALAGSTVTITVSLGEAPAQSAAGKSKKRRLYVEIDGQRFDVKSEAEAVELLQRARAIAESQAEKRAETAASNVTRIARRTGSVPQLQIKTPEIEASPDLNVSQLIADIRRLYDKAAIEAELRVLLQKQMDDEDEELLLL